MVAGGAAQILGESFRKSQIDAGGPSKILNPVPNILIDEPVALEKKWDVFIAIYETKATLFTDQTGRDDPGGTGSRGTAPRGTQ